MWTTFGFYSRPVFFLRVHERQQWRLKAAIVAVWNLRNVWWSHIVLTAEKKTERQLPQSSTFGLFLVTERLSSSYLYLHTFSHNLWPHNHSFLPWHWHLDSTNCSSGTEVCCSYINFQWDFHSVVTTIYCSGAKGLFTLNLWSAICHLYAH